MKKWGDWQKLRDNYEMELNGSFKQTFLQNRKYFIGIDWEPYSRKGCIVISFHENDTTCIESTIHVETIAKDNFNQIVESIAQKYKAHVYEEK